MKKVLLLIVAVIFLFSVLSCSKEALTSAGVQGALAFPVSAAAASPAPEAAHKPLDIISAVIEKDSVSGKKERTLIDTLGYIMRLETVAGGKLEADNASYRREEFRSWPEGGYDNPAPQILFDVSYMIDQYGVLNWNSNYGNQADADRWSITVNFNDGSNKRVICQGAYPDGWEAFNKKLGTSVIGVLRDKAFNGEWAPKISEEDWNKAKGRDRLLFAYGLSQRLEFNKYNGLAGLTGEFSECNYRIEGGKAVITVNDYSKNKKTSREVTCEIADGEKGRQELHTSDGRVFVRLDGPELKWVKDYLAKQETDLAADAGDAASINIDDIYLNGFTENKKPLERKDAFYIKTLKDELGKSYRAVDKPHNSHTRDVFAYTSTDDDTYGAVYYIPSDRNSFNGTIHPVKNNPDFLRDNIKACLFTTDDQMNEKEAEKLTGQLLDFYTDRTRWSGVLAHNGYRLRLAPERSGSIDIFIDYGYEWLDGSFNPAKYNPVNFDEMKAATDRELKYYYLRGTVKSIEANGLKPVYTVEDKGGHTYKLVCNLTYTVHIGQMYDFYGIFAAGDPEDRNIQITFMMSADG